MYSIYYLILYVLYCFVFFLLFLLCISCICYVGNEEFLDNVSNFEPSGGFEETVTLLKRLIPASAPASADVPPVLMELDYLGMDEIDSFSEFPCVSSNKFSSVPSKDLSFISKGELNFFSKVLIL